MARGVIGDHERFEECLGSQRYRGRVEHDLEWVTALDAKDPPLTVINGRWRIGHVSQSELRKQVLWVLRNPDRIKT